jgi:peptidoglycan biosynthesis protein MviN/MurJ (putative lipid II flippase)
MIASGVALIANIALNLGLIPKLGPLGAALATLATEIVVTTPFAWACGRALRVRPHARPIIAALLATVVWLATWYFFGAQARQHIDSDWLIALAYVGVWLVVFEMIAPTWAWSIVRTARRRSEQMQANRPHPSEGAQVETITGSDIPVEDAAITYALEEQRS